VSVDFFNVASRLFGGTVCIGPYMQAAPATVVLALLSAFGAGDRSVLVTMNFFVFSGQWPRDTDRFESFGGTVAPRRTAHHEGGRMGGMNRPALFAYFRTRD